MEESYADENMKYLPDHLREDLKKEIFGQALRKHILFQNYLNNKSLIE